MNLLALSFIAALTVARVVHFAGGTATVENANGVQHVVIKDRKGGVSADSYCEGGAGSYDAIVQLGAQVQRAAAHRDKSALAALMQYPLRVNAPSGQNSPAYVTNKTSFVRRFEQIFTPRTIKALADMEPHDVFCRDGMSMLANGVIWASIVRGKIVKGAIVNRF